MKNLYTSLKVVLGFTALLWTNIAQAQQSASLQQTVCTEACHKQRLLAPMRSPANNQNIDVKYHRFRWTITPSTLLLRGAVFTRFKMVSAPSDVLEFDLIDSLTVDSVRYHNQRLTPTRSAPNVVHIQLPAAVSIGTQDTVEVFYHGNPPQGAGFGSYIKSTHNGANVIWTLSEPYGARDWWPCKQDLNDKIDSTDTYVNIPSGNKAAGNGLLVGVTPLTGGRQLYHWKHKYPIAAYLVCTAVTNYSEYTFKVKMSTDSLLMQNYFYPEYAAGFRNEVQAIKGVLQFYDSLFVPYAFMKEKYGHAQFSWGGGMEHQTMSFMINMDFDLQAHELAHQWFGDRVTCGSWRDIWLNEGFATYCAALAGHYRGHEQNWTDFKNSGYAAVSSLPGGSVYLDDTSSVDRVFDGRLTYTKGAWVLHMLRYRMGDSAFYAGLRNYLNDPAHAYGFARTQDLKAHLEISSGQNLTEYFQDWVYGEGVPSYAVTWLQSQTDSVNITLDQSQSSPTVEFFETPIPVRILYRNNTSDTVILNNTHDMQSFRVPTRGTVSRILFDPEKWILTEGTVTGFVATAPKLNRADLALYPNPAVNGFTLNGLPLAAVEVSLNDLSGRELARLESAGGNEYRLPAGLAAGSYTVQVMTAEGRVTLPLAVVR